MEKKILVVGIIVLLIVVGLSGCQELPDCGTKTQAYIEYIYQNNWNQTINMDVETSTCNSFGSSSKTLDPGENLSGSEIRNIWSSGGLEIKVSIYNSSFLDAENYTWMPSFDGERIKFLIYVDETGEISIEETTPSDKHPLEQ